VSKDSKDNHAELKRLQRQQAEAEATLKSLTRQRDEFDRKIAEAAALKAKLEESIDDLKHQGGVVVVTEHAILRYLERAMGVDIEAAKKGILPVEVERVVLRMGDGEYPVGASHRVVVKGGVVVTVLTEDMQ
jgi:hypothetical protein